jgi:hypothetical protein
LSVERNDVLHVWIWGKFLEIFGKITDKKKLKEMVWSHWLQPTRCYCANPHDFLCDSSNFL